MEYRLKVDSGAFGEVNKDYEKVPSFEDTCKVGSCGRGWMSISPLCNLDSG